MNKEVKNLMFINIISIIVFIGISFILSNNLYKQYKIEQINNNSYLIGNLVNKYPELEGEIISSLISNKNYDLGHEVLVKYGLTNPNTLDYDENIKTTIIITNLIFIVLSLVILFLINIFFIRRCYKKTNKIDKYIKNILNDDYSLNINEYCDGDISNLKKDVYNVALKLQNKDKLLQKEKEYLEETLEDIYNQIKLSLTDKNIDNNVLKTKKDDTNEIETIKYVISNLLKLSKLDNGTTKLKKEKTKVSTLITKSIEPIRTIIQSKKIDVKFNIRNTEIIVDVDWTSEALLNILKNACEHTKDEIIIESTTNTEYTEIRISDNGLGIAKNDLPHIFERFYKESNNKKNIGIGLNMSKKIIEMQNGSIEVDSKDKTTFIIRIPKNTI